MALFPDGVHCMESALDYYGYTDRTPSAWNLAVDSKSTRTRFYIESTIAEKFDAVLQRMSGTSLELQGKSLEIRKFCGPIISGGTVMSFYHCSELSCVLQSPLIEERATYARPGRRICINRILYMKRRSRWHVI